MTENVEIILFEGDGAAVTNQGLYRGLSLIPLSHIESATDETAKRFSGPRAQLVAGIGLLCAFGGGLVAIVFAVGAFGDNFKAGVPMWELDAQKDAYRVAVGIGFIVAMLGLVMWLLADRVPIYRVVLHLPFGESWDVDFADVRKARDFIAAIGQARGAPLPIVRPQSGGGWFIMFPI